MSFEFEFYEKIEEINNLLKERDRLQEELEKSDKQYKHILQNAHQALQAHQNLKKEIKEIENNLEQVFKKLKQHRGPVDEQKIEQELKEIADEQEIEEMEKEIEEMEKEELPMNYQAFHPGLLGSQK